MKRKIKNDRARRRARRSYSIRKRIHGAACRPRLTVFRSSGHIYAQLVDDDSGITLVSASSAGKEMRATAKDMKKSGVAELVGKALADAAVQKDIKQVVFDRNGFPFHGRVAALAKGARAGGLEF